MTRKLTSGFAAAMLVAACSEEAPRAQQQQQEAAAAPAPGLYEASWSVTGLRSTDNSTPATELKQGASGTSRGCVGPDGIDPALFAEGKDECRATNSYLRNGRLSLQLECTRPGKAGQIMQSINGSTTADGIEAEVSTSTYAAVAGDYSMTRKLTARRVGECPAGGAAETAE